MTCQALFQKELTDEESNFWAQFLKPIPVYLLKPAFEQWNRTGRFFPKPKEIQDLIDKQKAGNRTKFYACEKNGCTDGWVVNEVDASQYKSGKARAAHRCECWYEYVGQRP